MFTRPYMKHGHFPPSSKVTGVRWTEAACRMLRATVWEPKRQNWKVSVHSGNNSSSAEQKHGFSVWLMGHKISCYGPKCWVDDGLTNISILKSQYWTRDVFRNTTYCMYFLFIFLTYLIKRFPSWHCCKLSIWRFNIESYITKPVELIKLHTQFECSVC